MRSYIYIASVLFLYLLMIGCNNKVANQIDLSGTWNFQKDALDIGVKENWYNKTLKDQIKLPGSMASNGKGDPVSITTQWTGQIVDSSFFISDKYAKYREDDHFKIPFWLQAETHYLGVAWYQKEVDISKDWEAKDVSLFLERCHWETRLWIDDVEVGMQNSLSTAHRYDLSKYLKSGRHKITIRVDNRIKDINPGINAHSISDHTQSNWNGITGDIRLIANPKLHIKKLNIYPNVSDKKIKVEIWLKNSTSFEQNVELELFAESFNSSINQKVQGEIIKKTVASGSSKITVFMDMGKDVLLWDEFNPNLYKLSIRLSSKLGDQEKIADFGMREFKSSGTRFAVNDKPVFLRGTLESSIFPKTGFPSTSVDEWIRIFRICKSHGLNHVRFHSHCPPEAAFIAADSEGVYLQVETASWANGATSVGDGKPIDKWIYQEAHRILEAYGNHPSFCLMASGNEPGGANQNAFLGAFVLDLKQKDNRRVYTGGAGWPYLEVNDFYNSPQPRIQGWGQGLESIINKSAPKTDYDFEEIVSKIDMPCISHEIGQWCAYPNFKEIKKYDGVLKAKNFEIFQETLNENKLGHLADSLLLASGKLQALCYKADIEAALRTPGFAGFQLLDLHDFPGQGSALIGVLDAFWDEKGYISPEEFSAFCNQTVPLARMEKRVFRNTENFKAEIEVAHFGSHPLTTPKITWEIIEAGKSLSSGSLHIEKLEIDNCQTIGLINYPLNDLIEPKQLRLQVTIDEYSNGWDFWVYPESETNLNDEVYLTQILDDKAIQILNQGGKVLWSLKKGSLKPEYGGDIEVGFSSIFWNTAWTMGQAPHTLGILCDPNHKALHEFPTDYHSNWQWWDAMHHGQAIILDKFETAVKPIVRIVDDWFENRSLGLLFEARAGKGKIIVSGADLLTNKNERLEAQQLLFSLKAYMNTADFNPENEISLKDLKIIVKDN